MLPPLQQYSQQQYQLSIEIKTTTTNVHGAQNSKLRSALEVDKVLVR